MATLKAITMKDSGDGSATPASVVVELSTVEMLLIANFVGKYSTALDKRRVLAPVGLESAVPSLYDCLAGDVINRFWDGGLAEAVEEFRP